jgi:hypothetical protein
MTKDEALKMALEVMRNQGDVSVDEWIATEKAIKEALAQPEQDGECKHCTDGCPACDARKLPEQDWIERERAVGYREGHRAALAQRTWVGLTDEEIRLQWSEFWEAECHPWAIDFAQAIEAKLRSKNNG